ncbi:MAG: riboflavin synthase [Leptospira sp.]|nr:riboflavin synthase [Leptospira sp.]
MFTGLIETTGLINSVVKTEGGKKFSVSAVIADNDIERGDSISINGACQTVTEIDRKKNIFLFYSSFKTLELTNFGILAPGDEVNLERAMLLSTRLGGHLVQGHVDGTAKIKSRSVRDNGNVEIFRVSMPAGFSKYIIPRGSISVDGISLTVTSISKGEFELILIPETLKKTNAKHWKKGTVVNLEADLVARYIENLYSHTKQKRK